VGELGGSKQEVNFRSEGGTTVLLVSPSTV